MTPRDALRKMVKAYPGSYEAMAARVGKTPEVLRKELTDTQTFKLGMETAQLISEICIEAGTPGCYDFVNAIAADSGGFVQLPVLNMTTPGCVHHSISAVTTELSHVVTATLDSYADNDFSDNDLIRIRKEAAEALAAIQRLIQTVEAKHAAGKAARGEA